MNSYLRMSPCRKCGDQDASSKFDKPRRMTPLHMEILLHYNCRPGDWDCPTQTHSDYVMEHLKAGLLEPYKDPARQKFCISERGEFWLNAALNLPLPVSKWEIPKESDK